MNWQWILESAIRTLLLALAVGAILKALRIHSAPARHAAWTGVLIAMLLMPAFHRWGPHLGMPLLPAERYSRVSLALEVAPSMVPLPGTAHRAVTLKIAKSTQPKSPTWEWIVVGIYGGGAILLLLRLALGTYRARSLARSAPGSSLCAAPVTVGWLHPVVVLPEGWQHWPKEELDAVLIHEREHARRRDPLVQWVALFNRAVYWFHPLAWWLERELGQLAEEACDAAVLRSGQNPCDYAEYLINLARAVNRNGARISICGTAMAGSKLSIRIRRIVDGQKTPAPSRVRIMVAATLCSFAFVVIGACSPERVQTPVSVEAAVARRMAENFERNRRLNLRAKQAETLTSEQAQTLEQQVKADPHNADDVWLLARHYQYTQNARALNRLTLWFLENARDEVWPWNIGADDPEYSPGKAIWIARLKEPGAKSAMYRRAALYLEAGDKPLAEQILLEGAKAFPAEDWTMTMAYHYAQTLVGGVGHLESINTLKAISVPAAHSVYSQQVRLKMSTSTDARLLMETAGLVEGYGRYYPSSGMAAESLELSRFLIDRALMLNPADEKAKRIKRDIENAGAHPAG